MKILIAAPAIDRAEWYFTASVANLIALSARIPNLEIAFMAAGGYGGVDNACNLICKEMLADNSIRGMLLLGSDANLHPHTLLRLMESQALITAALCFKREAPFTPVVGDGKRGFERFWVDEVREWLTKHPELIGDGKTCFGLLDESPPDSLRKCDFVGTHTMLIHREVIERINPPWFVRDSSSPVAGREDINFELKVKKAGIDIYVDLSVIAGHAGFGAVDFMVWDDHTEWNKNVVSVSV